MKNHHQLIFLKDKQGLTYGPYSVADVKKIISKPHNMIAWIWFKPINTWSPIDFNLLITESSSKTISQKIETAVPKPSPTHKPQEPSPHNIIKKNSNPKPKPTAKKIEKSSPPIELVSTERTSLDILETSQNTATISKKIDLELEATSDSDIHEDIDSNVDSNQQEVEKTSLTLEAIEDDVEPPEQQEASEEATSEAIELEESVVEKKEIKKEITPSLRYSDLNHLECSIILKKQYISVQLDHVSLKKGMLFILDEKKYRHAPDIPLFAIGTALVINILNSKKALAENCKAKITAIKSIDKEKNLCSYQFSWIEEPLLLKKMFNTPASK